MASSVLRVPGVYVQEPSARVARALPTGVPVLVGLLNSAAAMPDGTPSTADFYGPVPLYHKSDFLGGASVYLGHAINGFFDNGGGYCYVIAIKADPASGAATAARLTDALNLTSGLADVDLIAIPDAQALLDTNGVVSEALVLQVQRAMIQHCTVFSTRVAVMDALRNKSAAALISDQVKKLAVPAIGPTNATLYHPWIRTIESDPVFVPPSGQICGIISRTDTQSGVFKAPANANVQDATDLDADLDLDSLADLNDAGVNCIRSFPARGIRVWGARTVSPDPDWTYLNVRRLILTTIRWMDVNMTWAAFEPNVPALWARIQRELETYLTSLWRLGALQGDAATDAFFVRCDAELNPAESREIGQVITQIGLAPTAPAEFIIVTVQHLAGTTELT